MTLIRQDIFLLKLRLKKQKKKRINLTNQQLLMECFEQRLTEPVDSSSAHAVISVILKRFNETHSAR